MQETVKPSQILKLLFPPLQSDLAKEITTDPYNFDFLCLTKGYLEKELENTLTDNITKFYLN